MRKRKRQIVLYLLLIGALYYVYIHVNQVYFSPEDVFYACERGLRSGPSKEIVLEFDTENGTKVLVGRQEKGLFVVPVEKDDIFFWRMAGGGVDGFLPCEEPLNGYLTYGGNYLGLCLDKEIEEISFILGNHRDINWRECISSVEEELIFIEADKFAGDIAWDSGDYIAYTEGRNAEGEVIYQKGEANVADTLRKGNFRPSEPVIQQYDLTVSDAE